MLCDTTLICCVTYSPRLDSPHSPSTQSLPHPVHYALFHVLLQPLPHFSPRVPPLESAWVVGLFELGADVGLV